MQTWDEPEVKTNMGDGHKGLFVKFTMDQLKAKITNEHWTGIEARCDTFKYDAEPRERVTHGGFFGDIARNVDLIPMELREKRREYHTSSSWMPATRWAVPQGPDNMVTLNRDGNVIEDCDDSMGFIRRTGRKRSADSPGPEDDAGVPEAGRTGELPKADDNGADAAGNITVVEEEEEEVETMTTTTTMNPNVTETETVEEDEEEELSHEHFYLAVTLGVTFGVCSRSSLPVYCIGAWS